ncbi:alpha/beta hydrolase [Nocardioides sp. BP30]|uniref:alpha/beta hydrolase n=1 Tax=Nocardioides sp. BP30 TaxID=3036374 RepID=UPI00246839CF|nr:alpha/beta hydrolase [Nocardioides sp. BP30]WGL53165.1 alpha/beta hydrolase [Nocardioides sp. BP30]
MPAPLALRTRIFATVLKRFAPEPADAHEMIALRGRRDRLRETVVGRALFGRIATGVVTTERTAEVNGGTQRLLVHRPAAARPGAALPIVVNLHGGGWCLGAPEQSAWLASHVAAAVGAVVVSPSYRLAPEHPYPAAADDAWAVLRWIADHAADLGGDATRLAVMGDSAGGNLAAVCALHAREAGGPALRAQVLIYPAVEMYERYPSEEEHAHAPVLTSTQMHIFSRLYLGEQYGVEDWQASPLRADSHAGLPPTLILTAGHDPLRDHGSRYADRLRPAGVEVHLRDYGPAIHGFVSLPGVVPAARLALDDIAAFLRKRL